MITSSNSDRLQGVVLTQKQEWVTPKISLMEAGDTEGKLTIKTGEFTGQSGGYVKQGPS
jgi:hypothetical protein